MNQDEMPTNGFKLGLGYGFIIAFLSKILIVLIYPQMAIKAQIVLGAIISFFVGSNFVPTIWPNFLKRNTGIVSAITAGLLLYFFNS